MMQSRPRSLKWYRELAEKKGRLEAGAFIIEGDKAIRQGAASHPDAIMEILAVDEPPPFFRKYPARLVTSSQFQYVSSNQTPQGILAVVRLPADVYTARLPGDIGAKILLLEDIQDPGNTGTLIRTAAAFGFSGVIMTENGADPFSPKCVQATAGSILSAWLRRTKDYLTLARELKNKNFSLVAAVLDGDVGPEILAGRKELLLALGNEAAGVSKLLLDAADYRLRIPVDSKKAESLNVAACGAILMYLSV